jgi:hypothetical protein
MWSIRHLKQTVNHNAEVCFFHLSFLGDDVLYGYGVCTLFATGFNESVSKSAEIAAVQAILYHGHCVRVFHKNRCALTRYEHD